MAIKYKEERDLLLGKLYEKRGCTLNADALLEVVKMIKLSEDDLMDLFDILSKRGFITIENTIDTQVNENQIVNVVINIKSMTLTTKGLNYWEERLEK